MNASAAQPQDPATVSTASTEARATRLPFDPFRVIDSLWRYSWLCVALGVGGAAALAFTGLKRFETLHTATAQLIKQEVAAAPRQSEIGDPFVPRDLPIPTLVALSRSSPVLERTEDRLAGEVTEAAVKAGLVVTTERNTDIVRVGMTSDRDAATALATLEAYVRELLGYTREMQRREAAEAAALLEDRIAQTDSKLEQVHEEILAFGRREDLIDADKQLDAWLAELGNYSLKYQTLRLDHETLDLRIREIEGELCKTNAEGAKLVAARTELDQLRLRYTDAHPAVMEARDRLALLEEQVAAGKQDAGKADRPPASGDSEVAQSLYLELVRLRSEKKVIGEQLGKIDKVREDLRARLDELPRKSMDYAVIKSRQQDLQTSRRFLAARLREIQLHLENSDGYYRLLSIARPQDVVTEKPVKKLAMVTAAGFCAGAGLAAAVLVALTLRDRRVCSPRDLAFATGASVIGSLGSRDQAEADSAGVRRQAFRFWNRLLAHLQGFAGSDGHTIGLLDEGDGENASRLATMLAEAAAEKGWRRIVIAPFHGGQAVPLISLADALAHPQSVVGLLQMHGIVHVLAPASWTADRSLRGPWQAAVALWGRLPGTVVLASLPDAGQPGSVVAAESLTALVWATRSGASLIETVRETLDAYRDAGCRLAAGFLNHAPALKPAMLARRALMPALAAALGLCMVAPPAATAQGVRLGPGDTVHISMPGFPGHQRVDVAIAPDGTLTFDQARQIRAAGLTIDELRSRLSDELRAYYRNAVVVVTPGSLQSNKVHVLGKVVKKGSIVLDRPLSLMEVVARAGGLETGLFQQNTVELADLRRSFVMRGGNRLAVDMESLFLRGDMSQNVRMESGDYVYFPSANSNEIYVLGNVRMQGSQGLLAHTSVHSAIAQAGGFAPKAYTRRVLVVRGSLSKPETHEVDMEALLRGESKGFRLEPKDIVFVADHPWARAEELLHFALHAFMQGAVSTWAGLDVDPFSSNSRNRPDR